MRVVRVLVYEGDEDRIQKVLGRATTSRDAVGYTIREVFRADMSEKMIPWLAGALEIPQGPPVEDRIPLPTEAQAIFPAGRLSETVEIDKPRALGPTDTNPPDHSGHTRHVCDCEEVNCPYCNAGLFTCDVCGASEGELTRECPGSETGTLVRQRVMDGKVDYYGGEWHTDLEEGS